MPKLKSTPSDPESGLWPRVKLVINAIFLIGVLASVVPVMMLTRADRQASAGKIVLRFMYWGGPEQLVQEEDVRAAFLEQMRREGRPLALLMVDMDHLKTFNDTYGHPAGDRALRVVAGVLRAQAGGQGVACRWGGEEFVLLLASDDAAAVAEAVRAGVAAAEVDPGDARQRVTASLGWALLRDGEEGEALLERADAACYRAKSGGRNRVEAAP